MANLNNPTEIAREAFRLLATRRIPPTPENYQILYHEIAGVVPNNNETFPSTQAKLLADALPRVSPEQLRLNRELEQAIRNEQWEMYQAHLINYVNALADTQQLAWNELIGELIRNWESRQADLTQAKKREALEHVLNTAGRNPERLFSRLQNLCRSWGQGLSANELPLADGESPAAAARPGAAAEPAEAPAAQNELRELFAFTLDTAIASQLGEAPRLAEEAKLLANEVRRASRPAAVQELTARLRKFAFRLELQAEDQGELRKGLLALLRLLVENISELLVDDHWLSGQVEIIRSIIDQPLSQRTIEDAERRIKDVIFKQSQLKQSLRDAKEALKHMLTGFVDHLADFAGATSSYHDKIGGFAEKISAANDIGELEQVIAEVMRETRDIQSSAQRSRDELRATQRKVLEANEKIEALEQELEQASQLVRYDQLTGVLNRRGMEEMFDKEIGRAGRRQTPLSVALLDIDNFKKLNDSLGHQAGDQALIHLATVVRETLRPQDTVARFGGEEFVLLLPETTLDDAATVVTRVQRELTRRFFLHDNQKMLITFSGGVTEMRPGDLQDSILKRADAAMYQAKQSGKNRVCCG
jgi:diguanylate cyclase